MIHPNTHMGKVHLTVANLNRSLDYYQNGIGLHLNRRVEDTVYLGAGGKDLLVLQEQPGARPTRGTTGLYHYALLVPSRIELARTLHHLIATNTPIGGASDHAVSEALYLTDPDGHGIEIYRDRPRSEWQFPGSKLKMTVDPFDFEGVLAELSGSEPAWNGVHADTMMGHVHLHVAYMPETLKFYVELLGMDLMAQYGTMASFVAAGGYHHHLGLNTWAGVGAPPPPTDTAHLLSYEIVLPNAAALAQTVNHLQTSGVAVMKQENGYYLQDPSQNGIILVAAQ